MAWIMKIRSLLISIIPNIFLVKIKNIFIYLCSYYYIGQKYQCPICNRKFRTLLPSGKRPNALCPKCGSEERHRLIWLYLIQRTNLFKDHLRILHFAPEKFFQKKIESCPNLNYISADLSHPSAMIKMDITDILFKDNTFDVILCSHVLEHIQNDHKAMKELFRVLKPGGWAILLVPIQYDKTFEDKNITTPEARETTFGQWDHVRSYGLDYKDRLEKAGFVVKVIPFTKELGESAYKYRLHRAEGEINENIYLCLKKSIPKS